MIKPFDKQTFVCMWSVRLLVINTNIYVDLHNYS